jgi:tetratricopeptide (TPR) repeat protein
MAFEEIERLKERLKKTPDSKLFVPLAEEYKKVGMLDEAIEILNRGLERYPNYMSARVSLGKIYFDKGMLSEAGAEFVKVVSAIPDNLYAHKKLAEIYRDLGEKEKATDEFRKVLTLNPTDEDAARSLANLEEKFVVHEEATEIVKAIMKEEKPPEVPISEEKEDKKELREAHLTAEEIKGTLEEQKGLLEGEEFISEKVFEESKIAHRDIEEVFEREIFEESPISLFEADSYISQGKYAEALNVYRRILSAEPRNINVLQRIEELKTLLNLLGRGKEELIVRLNDFLEGIKKRKNEFFKTS